MTLQYIAPKQLWFGSCQLDCLHRSLKRSDQAKEIRLPSAETLLFAFMLEHAGELHDKEHLLFIGWEGRPISPNSLTVAIANLRRHLLGLDMELEIRSIPKKGYILNLMVPLERSPQPEHEISAPRAQETPSSASPLPESTFWFKRILLSVNVLSLTLLALLGLISASEWLTVDCQDDNGNIICALDTEQTQTRDQLTLDESGDTLWLISGPVQIKLSQRNILNLREEKNDESH